MVRGRMGGTGAAFNLGEVTATRCALRAEGRDGHAIVQGRDVEHATCAAWIDALMQGPRAAEVFRLVLEPLAEAERRRRETRARKAEATRVDFETMARGED
jgi:alpha-D-ribose 1-methylphosphonate 5-triphosphate synthase subunit PhnG